MTTPHHLHPATIAVAALRKLPSFLIGIPVLATVSRNDLGFLALAALAVAAVTLGLGWLRWRAFTYRIDADSVTITHGLFHTTRRILPIDRIQDVSIERKPLARLFGLAVVRIETGGGDTNEGLLDSVSLAEAERLRGLLRGRPALPGVAAPPAERLLFAMDGGRVLRMGAFGFSLVWLAAIVGVFQLFDRIPGIGIDFVRERAGMARDLAIGWITLGHILLLGALLLGVGVIAGFVRTLVTEHGFRLTLADGRFRRVRGLLTRTEVVVALSRIQLALVERGPVGGRLGWAALRVQTLGGSDDAGGRQMLAPFARADEIAQIVAAAGLPRFDPLPLRTVARNHVVRAVLLRAGGPLGVILAGGIVFPPMLFGLLALPVPVIAALLARRHHRYALGDDGLQVARGVLTRREWTVPVDAVQVVTLSSSWLQRRLNLATVQVDTAGARGLHRPDIVDLAPADAVRLATRLFASEMNPETITASGVRTTVTSPPWGTGNERTAYEHRDLEG